MLCGLKQISAHFFALLFILTVIRCYHLQYLPHLTKQTNRRFYHGPLEFSSSLVSFFSKLCFGLNFINFYFLDEDALFYSLNPNIFSHWCVKIANFSSFANPLPTTKGVICLSFSCGLPHPSKPLRHAGWRTLYLPSVGHSNNKPFPETSVFHQMFR